MTVRDALAAAKHRLAEVGIEAADREAKQLLAHVLDIPWLQLGLESACELSEDQSANYNDTIGRRCQQEPLQYIIGTVPFRDVKLRVTPDVLIPRPETEYLVEVILKECQFPERPVILDVGTGSGCLAIAIASALTEATIIATDISGPALLIAKANAASNLGAQKRVTFLQTSIVEAIAAAPLFDLVVSNPPYVDPADRESLAPEVVDWEPATALFSSDNGLHHPRQVLQHAQERLKPGGWLAMEVGLGQAQVLADEARGFVAARVVADLTGRERYLLAKR